MRISEGKIIYICFLERSFNLEWYWQCAEGNDDDRSATVRRESGPGPGIIPGPGGAANI